MELTQWIRSQAATGQPLNIHAVQRERPDLLELAFAGPAPRGWHRSLIDAGVDPYKIVLEYEDHVECAVCGMSWVVLGKHLKHFHGMTGEEYRQEFGRDHETTSESYREGQTGLRPIAGIAHWERLWSHHYVIDWILWLHEESIPLNSENILQVGMALGQQGRKRFGSWDGALRAAGLDPAVLRANPPERQWTRLMVIEGFRNFAKLKQENPKRKMSTPLQMAASRFFPSRQAACQSAGLEYEKISSRARFKVELVARLVASIRALEPLKGRERRQRIDAIYHKNSNLRIILRHYGSLQGLAAEEGISPRVVSRTTYRDEADVDHDLDVLEREGKPLTHSMLTHSASGLYLVMRETGWGMKRLKRQVPPLTFPPCNPRSGLLRDRMIILRRRLRITMTEAAEKAGICSKSWGDIEGGKIIPTIRTSPKIERLLEEHQIPVSTAPHTPQR